MASGVVVWKGRPAFGSMSDGVRVVGCGFEVDPLQFSGFLAVSDVLARSAVSRTHSARMDSEDDGMDPWDREEFDMMGDGPPVEEELMGPPEEEHFGLSQAAEVQEPRATFQEPESSSKVDSVAVPLPAAVLPVLDACSETPKRGASLEPSAQQNSPPQLGVLESPPKLRRVRAKTTVPVSVCPPVQLLGWERHKVQIEEDFLSQHFFKKLDGRQRYNWVYEKVRGFYVAHLYPMTLDKKMRDAWDELKAAGRQQQGRSAFREVTVEERAKIAKAWLKAAEPPPYVAKIVEDLLVSKPLTRPVGRIRCKGALLTWMLPKGKVDISKVLAQEPTALSEVLDGLRADSNVQEAWKDIQLHAQTCKQVSGAADVAVSFEVCPLTWANEKEVQLHFHTFLKSEVSDLLLKCLNPYCFEDTKAHMSTTIHGIHARPSGGRGCWSGFFYCCIPEKTGTLWSWTTRAPFSGFGVNPNWILNLMKSGKLDTRSGRKMIQRCVSGTWRLRELVMPGNACMRTRVVARHGTGLRRQRRFSSRKE